MSKCVIGKPAPAWTAQAVIEGEFKTISLADFKGSYLVFFAWPMDFTFVCPTEIIAFSDSIQQFKDIGCEVVGWSTDSVYSHLAWCNTSRKQGGLGGVRFPMVADITKQISKDYDILIEEGENAGVALRGLFIIGPDGRLRQKTVNDLQVGRSVEETLRLVRAFQFTDEHGEVCPAGWQPGAETMKADPAGSKSYFEKQ